MISRNYTPKEMLAAVYFLPAFIFNRLSSSSENSFRKTLQWDDVFLRSFRLTTRLNRSKIVLKAEMLMKILRRKRTGDEGTGRYYILQIVCELKKHNRDLNTKFCCQQNNACLFWKKGFVGLKVCSRMMRIPRFQHVRAWVGDSSIHLILMVRLILLHICHSSDDFLHICHSSCETYSTIYQPSNGKAGSSKHLQFKEKRFGLNEKRKEEGSKMTFRKRLSVSNLLGMLCLISWRQGLEFDDEE
ncbi:hypothetical protein CEXT_398481 [Caerostris extrusa]|uniref:Uncharacterized protein n=1 Tax=Caerostris extrusa TaxID=172846 RepID=A0AAV4RNX9_CAEEX|nr:hypothetical protein CEXT_398481 [Caerostris extrusa]